MTEQPANPGQPATPDVLRLLHARPDLRIADLNAAANALTVLFGQVYFTPTLGEIITQLRGPPDSPPTPAHCAASLSMGYIS